MKWYPFKEVVSDVTSRFNKIKASDYKTEGQFKIIDQGKDAIAGYTDDKSLVNAELPPIIVFGDHTRVIKYEDTPIALGADGTKALKVNSRLANTLYVYYFLRSVKLKEAGYSRHFKFLKEIQIPIPQRNDEPNLNDQIRIAHLLSKVEGLIAQRKQHLQQLDDLLKSVFLEMFGDPVRNEKGWSTRPFSQAGKFTSGGTPSKSRDDFWSGDYPWVSPKDMKVAKILDSEDHISEKVFDETSLKRIAPGHLLIVVRGMILAHSFPIAINMVDVAINQDMKAIELKEDLRVIYVLHCLNSLKRQILKLITTAGHGTKKFDSDAMEKLFIPVPPPELQDNFLVIADKIEGTKSRYQQSLTDVENLYGALSQKAFKGELDLSRVPLKTITANLDAQQEDQTVTATATVRNQQQAIDLPDVENMLEALATIEGRQRLVQHWLEAYVAQLKGSAFSVNDFLGAAQVRMAELHPENGFELGISEYEQLKNWVFNQIEKGKLKLTRNIVVVNEKRQFGNQVILRARKSR